MHEFGSFSIANNINKVWVLRHRDLTEIPSLFAKGLRQVKDVMIVISEGMIFPLDLLITTCTSQEVIPIRFSGEVYQKEEKFHFVARGDSENEAIEIVFSREPSR